MKLIASSFVAKNFANSMNYNLHDLRYISYYIFLYSRWRNKLRFATCVRVAGCRVNAAPRDIEWKIGVDSKTVLASAAVLSDSAQMSDVLVTPASRSLLRIATAQSTVQVFCLWAIREIQD